jgi:hypothetical protein
MFVTFNVVHFNERNCDEEQDFSDHLLI